MTKVLYIEHDDDNLYMLKTRFERIDDFQVLTSNDSEQGCELALAERPDLILMDLEMPVVDRWEPVPPHPNHRRVRVCDGYRPQTTLQILRAIEDAAIETNTTTIVQTRARAPRPTESR